MLSQAMLSQPKMSRVVSSWANWQDKQHSQVKSHWYKIPSDGVPIRYRWRCSRALFGNHWSNKSEWWPLEGDKPWNLLFSSRFGANFSPDEWSQENFRWNSSMVNIHQLLGQPYSYQHWAESAHVWVSRDNSR